MDKLAYAPPGHVSKYLLPYTPIKRGDIIVFRYPVDIKQTFVKRVIGFPATGSASRISKSSSMAMRVQEPYKFHKSQLIDSYRDNFPSDPPRRVDERAIEMLEQSRHEG